MNTTAAQSPRGDAPTPGDRTRRHGPPATRVLAGVALGAAALAAAACGSVRPFLRPLPGAPTDTLEIEAGQLINLLGGVVAGEGFRIAVSSPEEGYLETEWFDTVRGRSGGSRTRHPHDVVRLRFFADPISAEETALVSEAVYRRTLDPSVPEREREVLLTPDHRGYETLQRIWSTVRSLRASIRG